MNGILGSIVKKGPEMRVLKEKDLTNYSYKKLNRNKIDKQNNKKDTVLYHKNVIKNIS